MFSSGSHSHTFHSNNTKPKYQHHHQTGDSSLNITVILSTSVLFFPFSLFFSLCLVLVFCLDTLMSSWVYQYLPISFVLGPELADWEQPTSSVTFCDGLPFGWPYSLPFRKSFFFFFKPSSLFQLTSLMLALLSIIHVNQLGAKAHKGV